MLLPQKNLAAQEAFTRACRDVAEGLQRLEELLAERPFLCLGPFGCDGTFKQFSLGWAVEKKARWWFQRFIMFIPKFGEDEPIFDEYLSNGLVQPPTRKKGVFHPKSEASKVWRSNH